MRKEVYALAIFIIITTGLIIQVNKGYGHGLGGDMAPPINFAGQNISVETRIIPQDLALSTIHTGISPILMVRFFNYDTNSSIPNVTMLIRVEKDNKLLLNGWFYDDNGVVRLKINPINSSDFHIYGEEELQLGGYYNRGEPVRVDAPIFLHGGLYKVSVSIRSAFTSRQLIDPPINFDTWISVADDNNFVVNVANKDYPITIRTYYDNIRKLSLNGNVLEFEMPFNWDENYVRYVPLVHEEVILPKDIPLASTGLFDGYVNGIKIEPSFVIVDPYTYPDKLIVHFILNTNTLENIRKELANKGEDKSNIMRFKLEPLESVNSRGFNTIVLNTDNGNAKVIVELQKDIYPKQESEIRLTFFDKNNALLRDMRYNIKFFDEKGNVLFEQNRYTPEGIDVIRYTFDKEGIAVMQINIIGKGFSQQMIDTSVSGTTQTNIRVVPEFPLAILVVGIAIGTLIVMMKKYSIRI